MRLILLNQHLGLENIPLPADNLVILYCFEEFTFGPLSNWDTPDQFWQDRTQAWRAIPGQELPDGDPMPHFVWHQMAPQHDIEELVCLPEEDWPVSHSLNSAAPLADRIEIWWDTAPSDCLWLWFVMAELTRLGINLDHVQHCLIDGGIFEQREAGFWRDMLLDGPDRLHAPRPFSNQERMQIEANWHAALRFPDPAPASVPKDANAARVFEVLAARQPDHATGLNRLHERLLVETTPQWCKMARIVASAMVASLDEGDDVGDRILHAALLEMAHHAPPLIEVAGQGAMRFCEVRLTQAGLNMQKQLQG